MQEIGHQTAEIPCALVGLGEAAHMQGKAKFAVLCLSLAEHIELRTTRTVSRMMQKRELEQIMVGIRRAMRPQMYEDLRNKGRKLTIEALSEPRCQVEAIPSA